MTQVVDQHFANILDNVPKLLTAEEVAQLFRVDPSTVIRWVVQHDLRCVKVGPKLHRFPKHFVAEFLSAHAKTDHTQ